MIQNRKKRLAITRCVVAAWATIALNCPNTFGQEASGDYLPGFENGLSTRLKYRQERGLWIDTEPQNGELRVTGLYPNSPAVRMRSPDGNVSGVKLEIGDSIVSANGRKTKQNRDLAEGLEAGGDWCELVVRDKRSGNLQVWLVEPVVVNQPVPKAQPQLDSVAGNSTKLYVVILASTTDEELGNSISLSLGNLQELFNTEILKNRCEVHVLSDVNCRADKLIATIEDLPLSPNDSLLVYYLGHGAYDPAFARDDPFSGQFLDLPGQDLLRKTVWDHMDSVYARMKVLVTDACNVKGEADPDVRFEKRTRSIAMVVRGATDAEWLFLGHRGRCDISAASSDQYAWYSPETGGWFTSCMINSTRSSNAWDSLRGRVIPETEKFYSEKRTEYLAAPATTKAETIELLRGQPKLTPRLLLTRVEKDANDPIGKDVQRTIVRTNTVSVKVNLR